MKIQRGKSPFSFPATGYIYAGEDSSVVMYLQGTSIRFWLIWIEKSVVWVEPMLCVLGDPKFFWENALIAEKNKYKIGYICFRVPLPTWALALSYQHTKITLLSSSTKKQSNQGAPESTIL